MNKISMLMSYSKMLLLTCSLLTVFSFANANSNMNFPKNDELKSNPPNTLNLTIYNKNNFTLNATTVIYFEKGATSHHNSTMDAYWLQNQAPTPNIYSIFTDTSYSIKALPPLTNVELIIPIGVIVASNGNYALSVDTSLASFPSTVNIYLEDRPNNKLYDFRTDTSYVFSLTTSNGLNRFYIHFDISTSINEIDKPQTANLFKSYTDNNTLFVKFNSTESTGSIVMYNPEGRAVCNVSRFQNGSFKFNIDGINTGIYIITAITDNKKYSKKILILK